MCSGMINVLIKIVLLKFSPFSIKVQLKSFLYFNKHNKIKRVGKRKLHKVFILVQIKIAALNPSRSHLMKVIALPTLGFSKPSHRAFSSTQTSLTSVFCNESLPLYL